MILISGATGFLGTHLLKNLCVNNTENIRALYRSEDKKKYTINFLKTLIPAEFQNKISQIEWIKADILNISELEQAFRNIRFVYHCATWVGNSPRDYNMMRKVNIEGTANMVNLSIANQVEKFCHVSSVATLGQYTDSTVTDEQAPRDTERYCSRYSITKFGAEMEVWRASQEGLDVVIVNPGVILGSGFFDSGSGLIFDKVLNNFKFYPPKQTGFVFIDDVIQAMLKLMQSDVKNQRYILVAENTSFKNVMEKIAKVFDCKPPKYKVNKPILYLLWAFQNILSLFKSQKTQITLNTIRQIYSKQVFNNKKSIQDLGLSYTSLDEAINLIFEDYKKLKTTT
ncbi:SDR family oxidoreductase [Flavobacterium sp. CS20]|uniref:SDR family oxidoreductase n=1 Tax=Flavobacterium sp. CS20 TaxID=2775246 RepID=UPI001B3A6F59|nr:SDR family oxidoreductase [Flavobacterium sp. CS20]QTY25924.1 SDR family oxidoreductase [Flavobacterium sp. CS20]